MTEREKKNASLKEHTVKVAGVILGLQLRDEFSFLSQESSPVKTLEEGMLFDLWSSTCNGFHNQSGWGIFPSFSLHCYSRVHLI